MDQVTYNKIKDFLDGNCSDDERQDIIKWITRSKENEKVFFRWEELYFLGKFKQPNMRTAEEKLLKRLERESDKHKKVLKMRYVFRYAAMIVALLAISSFAFWYFIAPHEEWKFVWGNQKYCAGGWYKSMAEREYSIKVSQTFFREKKNA